MLLSAMGLLAAACSGEDSSARIASANASSESLAGKLVISGSSTMAPLLRGIGDRFQAIHPGVKVEVLMGGSAKGLKDVRAGDSDIGMFGRAMGEDERDLFGFPIARDGISLVVHKTNPVANLTDDQVVGIYTGRITNWREVGGHDAAIAVISRTEGRSQFELFTQYFKLKAGDIKARTAVGDNELGILAVAGDPGAIVYISIGEAEQRAGEGLPIKLLALGGVAGTIQNVRTGSFPLSRALTLVTRELPSGAVKAFIDYSLSSQVTGIVREHNFVPYLD